MKRRKVPGLDRAPLHFAAALFACLAPAVPLQASSLFGVSTSVQGGGQGCGASSSYNTAQGGSGGQSTSPGNNSISDCTNTFSGSTVTGLTSASSQASETSLLTSDVTQTANQTGAANLANASLHASATSPAGNYGGFSTSIFWDTLSFSVSGATASTVTNIPLIFTADGSVTNPALTGEQADLQFALGGVSCFVGSNAAPTPGCNSISLAEWNWSGNTDQTNINSSSFITWTIVSENQSGFTIDGTLSLTGANPVVGLGMMLSIFNDAGSTADFSNTSSLTFQLPQNTTYTSSSGVFDTSSTPEPSTMVPVGVVIIGLGLRRKLRPCGTGHRLSWPVG